MTAIRRREDLLCLFNTILFLPQNLQLALVRVGHDPLALALRVQLNSSETSALAGHLPNILFATYFGSRAKFPLLSPIHRPVLPYLFPRTPSTNTPGKPRSIPPWEK